MSNDERTLLANLDKEFAQFAKAKVPEAAKASLQKKLNLAVADARILVTARAQLLKDIEALKARRKQLEEAVKVLHGRFPAAAKHVVDAQGAVAAARESGKNADPVLGKLKTALGEMMMALRDFSPFQEGDWQ